MLLPGIERCVTCGAAATDRAGRLAQAGRAARQLLRSRRRARRRQRVRCRVRGGRNGKWITVFVPRPSICAACLEQAATLLGCDGPRHNRAAAGGDLT